MLKLSLVPGAVLPGLSHFPKQATAEIEPVEKGDGDRQILVFPCRFCSVVLCAEEHVKKPPLLCCW